jgi:23S rRNA (guanosine2251-2'-O)-methyltransferase
MGKREGHREREGDWVYGIIPVEHALKASRRKVLALWVQMGITNERVRQLVSRAGGIPVRTASQGEMDKLTSGGVHQGIAAEVEPFPWETMEGIMEGRGPLVFLEGIEDPRNLGAIIRSSVATGAGRIILEKRRRARLSGAVAKAACGALEYVRLSSVPNLPRAMRLAKERGYWLVGTTDRGGAPLWEADLPEKVGVVIGGEGRGLREVVKRECDFWVTIPAEGPIGTYNASVAASIVLYELMRRRAEEKLGRKEGS